MYCADVLFLVVDAFGALLTEDPIEHVNLGNFAPPLLMGPL